MYETVRSQLPPELVLIETLWNVKHYHLGS